MSAPRPCKRKRDEPPAVAAALYVHVPVCLAKCAYCDFYSVPAGAADLPAYVAAAAAELHARAPQLRAPLDSIYVGGGTPTVLGADLLGRLLGPIAALSGAGTEFTVEANPATFDERVCDALAAAGVNRVSLGVQSFDERELAVLGRLHTPAQARSAVALLRAAGIASVSVDLIYAVPGQDMASWRRSLAQGLELGIEHMSCYGLSVEPSTPLWSRIQAGEMQEVDEGLQRECYFAAIDAAAGAGLEHYEISNFARAGRRCRHNLTYWHNLPYVGIGPAAASYLDGVRSTNLADLPGYIKAAGTGLPPPLRSERLTGRAAMAEAIMLGLRLIEGLDRPAFARRYGQDVAEVFPRTTARYIQIRALDIDDTRLRLARSALFAADTILADFLAEA